VTPGYNTFCVSFTLLTHTTLSTNGKHRCSLMMEAVSSTETSVNIYQTTRCNNPEHSYIQRCFGLLKCYMSKIRIAEKSIKEHKTRCAHHKSQRTHMSIKLTTTENPWFYLYFFFYSFHNAEKHENDILDF
jgi:hypothetical protein